MLLFIETCSLFKCEFEKIYYILFTSWLVEYVYASNFKTNGDKGIPNYSSSGRLAGIRGYILDRGHQQLFMISQHLKIIQQVEWKEREDSVQHDEEDIS